MDTPLSPFHCLSSYYEPGTVPITLQQLVPSILQQVAGDEEMDKQRGQVT